VAELLVAVHCKLSNAMTALYKPYGMYKALLCLYLAEFPSNQLQWASLA
jgi:hypothetical protein